MTQVSFVHFRRPETRNPIPIVRNWDSSGKEKDKGGFGNYPCKTSADVKNKTRDKAIDLVEQVKHGEITLKQAVEFFIEWAKQNDASHSATWQFLRFPEVTKTSEELKYFSEIAKQLSVVHLNPEQNNRWSEKFAETVRVTEISIDIKALVSPVPISGNQYSVPKIPIVTSSNMTASPTFLASPDFPTFPASVVFTPSNFLEVPENSVLQIGMLAGMLTRNFDYPVAKTPLNFPGINLQAINLELNLATSKVATHDLLREINARYIRDVDRMRLVRIDFTADVFSRPETKPKTSDVYWGLERCCETYLERIRLSEYMMIENVFSTNFWRSGEVKLETASPKVIGPKIINTQATDFSIINLSATGTRFVKLPITNFHAIKLHASKPSFVFLKQNPLAHNHAISRSVINMASQYNKAESGFTVMVTNINKANKKKAKKTKGGHPLEKTKNDKNKIQNRKPGMSELRPPISKNSTSKLDSSETRKSKIKPQTKIIGIKTTNRKIVGKIDKTKLWQHKLDLATSRWRGQYSEVLRVFSQNLAGNDPTSEVSCNEPREVFANNSEQRPDTRTVVTEENSNVAKSRYKTRPRQQNRSAIPRKQNHKYIIRLLISDWYAPRKRRIPARGVFRNPEAGTIL